MTQQSEETEADRQAEMNRRFPRPPGMEPETFPNQPSGGYQPNPANQTTELPPERQAPRPADGKVGQGRVLPQEQPTATEPSDK